MKATIEVPDKLYRQVKAKSALEGRAIREVAIELFQRYVDRSDSPPAETLSAAEEAARQFPGETIPPWFGVFGERARKIERHDMEAIRESIARGVAKERGL
jgi:hypothetical protein